MTIKSMLMVGALCLSTVSLVSAKSYEIHLSAPSLAGSVQLPAGEYKLKVDGANATLMDVSNGKTYTAPVKVESEEKRFEDTAVVTNNSGGANRIESIEIGGSNMRLAFGE